MTTKTEGDVFRALVSFLLTAEEPIAFLLRWNEGSFDICRKEWPEAPDDLYPAPVAVAVPWDNFPCYLIDHCEGDTITEEGLQHALAAMLANPHYANAPAQEDARDAARYRAARDNNGPMEVAIFEEAVGESDWTIRTGADADTACDEAIARHKARKAHDAARAAQGGAA